MMPSDAVPQTKHRASSTGRLSQRAAKHADEMTVREDEHVAGLLTSAGDQPIGASTDLFGRFAVRTSVAEEKPVRIPLQDLVGPYAFVIAVIPFRQIGLDDEAIAEAGQFGCALRSLAGTRPNRGELKFLQSPAELLSIALAVLGESQVGTTGVLAAQRPRRLAVTG